MPGLFLSHPPLEKRMHLRLHTCLQRSRKLQKALAALTAADCLACRRAAATRAAAGGSADSGGNGGHSGGSAAAAAPAAAALDRQQEGTHPAASPAAALSASPSLSPAAGPSPRAARSGRAAAHPLACFDTLLSPNRWGVVSFGDVCRARSGSGHSVAGGGMVGDAGDGGVQRTPATAAVSLGGQGVWACDATRAKGGGQQATRADGTDAHKASAEQAGPAGARGGGDSHSSKPGSRCGAGSGSGGVDEAGVGSAGASGSGNCDTSWRNLVASAGWQVYGCCAGCHAFVGDACRQAACGLRKRAHGCTCTRNQMQPYVPT